MSDGSVFFYGGATRLTEDGKLAITIEYVRGTKHLKRIKAGEAAPAVLDLIIGPKDAAQLAKRLLSRAQEARS